MFLEIAWEALESAGYDPGAFPGEIGVYAGSSIDTYLLYHLLSDRRRTRSVYGQLSGRENFRHWSETVPISSRHEPLISSICAAQPSPCNLRVPPRCLRLRKRVSASSIIAPTWLWRAASRSPSRKSAAISTRTAAWSRRTAIAAASMRTPPERCSAAAPASCLLKRLDAALADGDPIRAVIRGSAVNNDGARKVGYTAPSSEGQAKVDRARPGLGGRDRRRHFLCRVPRHRDAARRSDRGQRSHQGVSRDDGPQGILRDRHGEDEYRTSRHRGSGSLALIKTILSLEHESLPANPPFQKPQSETRSRRTALFSSMRSSKPGRAARGRASRVSMPQASAAPMSM